MRRLLTAVALAGAALPAAAADEIHVEVTVPAQVAIAPARLLSPAESASEWARAYGKPLPAGTHAFAVPIYQADFRPIRDGAAGRPTGVRIEFGVAAIVPVVVGEPDRGDCRADAAAAAIVARSEAVDRLNREIMARVAGEVRAQHQKEIAKALEKNRSGTLDARMIERVVAHSFRAARGEVLSELAKRTALSVQAVAALPCPTKETPALPTAPAPPSAPESGGAATPRPASPRGAVPDGLSPDQLQDVLLRMQRR